MKNWLKNIQVGIEDFLNCYENGEENKKPERKVYIMLWALTIFMGILSGYLIYCTYEIYKKSGWQSLYFIFCSYYSSILIAVFIVLLGVCLPIFKDKKRNNRKLAIMRVFSYIFIGLAIGVLAPMEILAFGLKRTGFISISHNLIALILNIIIYFLGYIFSLEAALRLYSKNIWKYTWIVILIYIIVAALRFVCEKVVFMGTEDDRYQYRQELKYMDWYVITVGTLFCGIIQQIYSEGSFSPVVFPISVFCGMEQLRQNTSYKHEKEMAFIKETYENLCDIRDQWLVQIINRSAIKVRIRLPIEAHQVWCEEKYMYNNSSFGKHNKKMEKIHQTFSDLKKFLSDEYAVYEDAEWERLKIDLDKNIQNMADLLNHLQRM